MPYVFPLFSLIMDIHVNLESDSLNSLSLFWWACSLSTSCCSNSCGDAMPPNVHLDFKIHTTHHDSLGAEAHCEIHRIESRIYPHVFTHKQWMLQGIVDDNISFICASAVQRCMVNCTPSTCMLFGSLAILIYQ